MYDDEMIISKRIYEEQQLQHTIYNILILDGKELIFSERSIEDQFSIVMPQNFQLLDSALARRKYPHEERPSIIYSNEATTINMCFDYYQLSGRDISDRLDSYRNMLKRMNPSYVFYSNKIYENDGKQLGYYDYRTPGLDVDLYQAAFFTDLVDIELFGWFNCPYYMRDFWEILVREMIQTIKPLSRKNK